MLVVAKSLCEFVRNIGWQKKGNFFTQYIRNNLTFKANPTTKLDKTFQKSMNRISLINLSFSLQDLSTHTLT